MLFDAALLNTQHYKVWIKAKVEQSRDSVVAIEKEPLGYPRLRSPTLYIFIYISEGTDRSMFLFFFFFFNIKENDN